MREVYRFGGGLRRRDLGVGFGGENGVATWAGIGTGARESERGRIRGEERAGVMQADRRASAWAWKRTIETRRANRRASRRRDGPQRRIMPARLRWSRDSSLRLHGIGWRLGARLTEKGQVPEWFNGHAWKACVPAMVPRVRISPCPPSFAIAARKVRKSAHRVIRTDFVSRQPREGAGRWGDCLNGRVPTKNKGQDGPRAQVD